MFIVVMNGRRFRLIIFLNKSYLRPYRINNPTDIVI